MESPVRSFLKESSNRRSFLTQGVVAAGAAPNNGKIIMFADGSAVLSGATFVTATNVATSKSINLNVSGPGHFSVTDNTFTGHGPGLVYGYPPNVLPPNLQPVSFCSWPTRGPIR